jgi:hypothetical protein
MRQSDSQINFLTLQPKFSKNSPKIEPLCDRYRRIADTSPCSRVFSLKPVSQQSSEQQLQAKLATLCQNSPSETFPPTQYHKYLTAVYTGKALRSFAMLVSRYPKRELFYSLVDFLSEDATEFLCILYGLDHTGKLTLMRQVLADMNKADLSKSALLQLSGSDTLEAVLQDLVELRERDYQYIFLNGITLVDDFVRHSSLLYKAFMACGMKIVLSCSDSLNFRLAEQAQLSRRCIILHTAFFSFQDFSVLSNRTDPDLESYIRNGSIMMLSDSHCPKASDLSDQPALNSYVDTAVVRSIQRSIHCSSIARPSHPRQSLLTNKMLAAAIHQLLDDLTASFLLNTLQRHLRNHTDELQKQPFNPASGPDESALDESGLHEHCTDIPAQLTHLQELLELRRQQKQSAILDRSSRSELLEHLRLLDIVQPIDVVALQDPTPTVRWVLTQPGMRFAQTDALVTELLQDEWFSGLSQEQRNFVQTQIHSILLPAIAEELILADAKQSATSHAVSVLQFPDDRCCMILSRATSCRISALAHDSEDAQILASRLADAQQCAAIAHRFGPIGKKLVLYPGKYQKLHEIQCYDFRTYLQSM